MDLTFQVPMQYCFLHHWTLPWPPGTSTTKCCFYFGPGFLFFLELFLHLSSWRIECLLTLGVHLPLTYLCPFILFMGFSRQEYWSGLPFSYPVGHVLSELSTMAHLSWVALHNMAHISIELQKAVIHVIILVIFLKLWFSFWRSWVFCIGPW